MAMCAQHAGFYAEATEAMTRGMLLAGVTGDQVSQVR
jgi:hypothetical protein